MTTHAPVSTGLDSCLDLGFTDSGGGEPPLRRELFAALIEVVSGSGRWSEQTAARIRGEGVAWAARGGSVSALRVAVQETTEHILVSSGHTAAGTADGPRDEFARRLADAARRVARELNRGFFAQPGRETPASVPEPPRPGPSCAPPAYAVIALRAAGRPLGEVEAVARAHGGRETAVLTSARGLYVLALSPRPEESLDLAGRIHRDLGGTARLAVHWKPYNEVTAGQLLVDDICAVVDALGFGPGVYQLDDVLVEYAAAQTPDIAQRLVGMVQPVLDDRVLRETLSAVISADGDTDLACELLTLRRTFFDRRLRRVEELTGRRVDGPRDLQVLRTAVAVAAIMRQ
ncbi:helix-turn-helix domain-containing protein [Actinacidiphila glaucinigra]|uniref:helix-turn-helix domain-containing protein n=1 Tax=Actinacidiphila glaucinigra TaxID=235986 RepID=UPI0036BF6E8D